MDDDVGVIGGFSMHARGGQKLDAEALADVDVRRGADERDLYLSPFEKRVHLFIGPPVDHLDRPADLIADIVDHVLVVFDRVHRSDHGSDADLQGRPNGMSERRECGEQEA